MADPGISTGTKFYVPFDEYVYRNIIDLCLDFSYSYQDFNTDYHEVAVSRCENIFETLLDFATDCKELPMHLRYPPIEEWSLMDQMPIGVVHPRRALNYVMKLMNELKRQQAKTGREPDYYLKKYGLGKSKKDGKADKKEIDELFQN